VEPEVVGSFVFSKSFGRVFPFYSAFSFFVTLSKNLLLKALLPFRNIVYISPFSLFDRVFKLRIVANPIGLGLVTPNTELTGLSSYSIYPLSCFRWVIAS
jgi:hypothetical protein